MKNMNQALSPFLAENHRANAVQKDDQIARGTMANHANNGIVGDTTSTFNFFGICSASLGAEV